MNDKLGKIVWSNQVIFPNLVLGVFVFSNRILLLFSNKILQIIECTQDSLTLISLQKYVPY